MEAFVMRGLDFILPGWPWLYESQIGVSTPCGGGIDPGNHRSRPRFVIVDE